MKVIGTQQFLQKKYTLLGLPSGEWRDILGDLPTAFMGIIYGDSGNGKTEFCVRLAKMLTDYDRVSWLSYEQGHGYDLKLAIERNNICNLKNAISWIDPMESKKKGVGIFEALDAYLGKRGTPRYVFIDSLDYTRITKEQYFALKEKYGKKKGIIFISHANGKHPKSSVGMDIKYDGGFGLFVKHFMAHPEKNRFGGNKPYIIWEERARELNPLYFEKLALGITPPPEKKRGRKPKQKPDAEPKNDEQ